MVLKYKKVRPGATCPAGPRPAARRRTCAPCAATKAFVRLQPMGRAVIPTGIAVELPGPEYVALVWARGWTLAVKNGLALSNGVGVIDSDYRGEELRWGW